MKNKNKENIGRHTFNFGRDTVDIRNERTSINKTRMAPEVENNDGEIIVVDDDTWHIVDTTMSSEDKGRSFHFAPDENCTHEDNDYSDTCKS